MASGTALGNDSNCLTFTSTENLEAFPPLAAFRFSPILDLHPGQEALEKWLWRWAEVSSACSDLTALSQQYWFWLIVFSWGQPSLSCLTGLLEGQLCTPRDCWDTRPALQFWVHLSLVVLQNFSSLCQNPEHSGLASGVENFAFYFFSH